MATGDSGSVRHAARLAIAWPTKLRFCGAAAPGSLSRFSEKGSTGCSSAVQGGRARTQHRMWTGDGAVGLDICADVNLTHASVSRT